MEIPGKWHFELVTPDMMIVYRIKDILHTGRTEYQSVDIMDTDTFGRCLVLDGKTQSTEADEHIYHDSLVHPAMLLHPSPRSVFIGGGGEGATLREVLRYPEVEKVTMLDLDPEVVQMCGVHLPNHNAGAFKSPKLELRHEDARKFLADCNERFDVIILDLVDPTEGGPAYLLYTEEFYRQAKAKLNPGGVLVTQAGPAGYLNYTECFTVIARTLSGVFPQSHPYCVFVPAFTTLWGFVLAQADGAGNAQSAPLPDQEPGYIDDLVRQRLPQDLAYYDGLAHRRMFSLPKYLRQGILAEERIVTDSSPVYMV